MKTLPKLCFCLLSAALFGQLATAQTRGTSSAQASQAEMPRVQFRTLALQRFAKEDVFYKTNTGFAKLPLDYFRPSPKEMAVLLPNGSFPIFEKTETAELGVQYVLKDRIALPAGSRRILILAAQTADKIALKAVADNLSSNGNDWLYINVTRSPIAVQLGDKNKPFPVLPGESVFNRADVVVGEGVPIRVVAKIDDDWEKIYARFWPVYAGQRCMVIFLENEGKIDVFNFFEAVDKTPG